MRFVHILEVCARFVNVLITNDLTSHPRANQSKVLGFDLQSQSSSQAKRYQKLPIKRFGV